MQLVKKPRNQCGKNCIAHNQSMSWKYLYLIHVLEIVTINHVLEIVTINPVQEMVTINPHPGNGHYHVLEIITINPCPGSPQLILKMVTINLGKGQNYTLQK